ncbi:hypothetical protein DWF00_06540 [Bosea caraganae]|uniref:Sulfur globule protein n=1 Tax=Bosea caraganae TaxID=2763117 RepID=A0A370L3J2_9HYPH|nr:hypothetical protein [Bosea caraganae]RDJ23014.1 hypothetical protein DWE98_17785 [Bosea caraganae]RDJ28794.1 hypothetical protein DWF00_06540 [Bosea caraganae]
MFRISATHRLAKLAIGAAALGLATLSFAGSSEAYDGRYGYGYQRPAYGFRPPPPPVSHGYWGQRQWRRYNDGYGFRAPPPVMRERYGWR